MPRINTWAFVRKNECPDARVRLFDAASGAPARESAYG
jgi:hypothetical protein